MPICDEWGDPPGAERQYACQEIDPETADVRGCDVGCQVCDPTAFPWNNRTSDKGARWLRPSNGVESRASDGTFKFPRSGFALRVPRVFSVEVANCFKWIGQEYFANTICDCVGKCESDSPAIYPDMIQTCEVFVGEVWPLRAAGQQMLCTGQQLGDVPLRISPLGGTNGNLVTLRTWHCGGNFMITCAGHNVSSQCPGGIPESPDYYSGKRAAFDYCYVTSLGGRFVEHAGASAAELSRIAAKNAALQWLDDDRALGYAGYAHLDQLDSARRYESDATDHNSQLDWLGRSFNMSVDPGELLPFDQLPKVTIGGQDVFTGQLFNSRHEVVTEWVVMGAFVDLSIVLPRIDDRPMGIPVNVWPYWRQRQTYPAIRARLKLVMGVRARFPDPNGTYQLVQSWRDPGDPLYSTTLSIDNNDTTGIPRVLPLNGTEALDWIVHTDQQGRAIQPPREVDVLYHLGPTSWPAWSDKCDQAYVEAHGSSFDMQTCAMAKGLSPLAVGVENSHPDTDDPNRIFEGSMTISFPWTESGCPA